MMKLRISDNGRFLVRDSGLPFFYLADTAWELFHRLNREEAKEYLQTRSAQGFTVIQCVVLAEIYGLNVPNTYGSLPLHNYDPTLPNEAYFEHIDFIVKYANQIGLTVGLLPTWGDKWNLCHGVGPEIFSIENARIYGKFLGQRYKEMDLIWILGGDRAIESSEHLAIIESMVAGLNEGDGGEHLMTFHPNGQHTSAQWFHQAPWLDFNMCQTGHNREHSSYSFIEADYALSPAKPCLDGEPGYENIPSGLQLGEALLTAYDVRKSLYWALFSGAHGHTYGCNEVWQCWKQEYKGFFSPQHSWRTALNLPGATQMRHARELLSSRSFLTRIPDQSMILKGQTSGSNHLTATRCSNGSYALIYFPSPVTATIDLTPLKSEIVISQWFNPRNGLLMHESTLYSQLHYEVCPPQTGEDWVLVLESGSDDSFDKTT